MSTSVGGVLFRTVPTGTWPVQDLSSFGPKVELVQFLTQIEDEGFATLDGDTVSIAWHDLYRLMASQDYSESIGLLGLPPVECWRPTLESHGSLTDPGFSITLAGWSGPDGRRPRGNVSIEGAVLRVEGREALLPKGVWETVEAVSTFYRSRVERGVSDADSNRRAWAAVRAKAVGVADLSDFLAKTVVLTPEKLTIDLRRTLGTDDKIIEVIPGFPDQPRRWLEMFDRLGKVPERYEIPDGEGLIHVLVPQDVQVVLREIKRMPGRRIAGDRAEAFLRNPYATLGPVAEAVIDPEQFEQAREMAGISFARFTARIKRNKDGHPLEVALLIEESLGENIGTEESKFESITDLREFLKKLDAKIAKGAQCCHWKGFDLEILGDTPDQAEILRCALVDMQGFKLFELLDLSRYSERIEGFGVEKPYYSPYIARKDEDGGWFPENVEFGLLYTPEGGGETIAVPLTGDRLSDFREAIAKAKKEKHDTFTFPGCPNPLPVAWAEDAVGTFGSAIDDVHKGIFDPEQAKAKGRAKERKGLVIKPNVDMLDYEERRGALALPSDYTVVLPLSLRPDIVLKDHQRVGVAWLQHLWSESPKNCRGVLLADDMGLGKTVQLLAFMATLLKNSPDMDPFLVIAPVSLLDNWKEEIDKFFKPGTFSVLTLYGNDLARKRLSLKDMDQEVVRDGITRLLRRDWIGRDNLVLTTYETLRDLEFSLARQKWSVVICDEAQKIKNPNAMVTRAAKKQNARFKIACTGTPVENTLTDIWCLFDFVQPGLLGALNDFGKEYRKPIEAETEEEKACVEKLRDRIKPQILRRMKGDVARDLPKKIEVPECRSLPISERQRILYAGAIHAFYRRRQDDTSGILSHLGLLHYLRRLCSDPRHPGTVGTDGISVAEIESHSPKMAWLMRQLESIKKCGEKAIVFCEFRDLQRTLQRVVSERFSFAPDVINGDTSVVSKNANNRQRRIKAFQEKPGFGVILLSPLAVGFGVNIQAANHVIHFTRPWNPAKEDQATDRAYRIGQTRDVFVYYPVVVAEDFITFDAKLDTLLAWKRSLATDMLNGTGELKPYDFRDLGVPGGGNVFEDSFLTVSNLESLDADAFEAFCAILWSKLGYSETRRTPKVRDGGIDVVAVSRKEGVGVLIQCKSSSIDGKELGWDAVKDVVAGRAAYAARDPGVKFSLLAVTNRRFNGTAHAQAKLNQVALIDGEGLAERLRENPIRRGELISYLWQSVGGLD
ncbi:MAG: restriction endonuclease [Magnetococcales bacterium]|nr:restriction endonuclease [Magnetococcales bacterium]